MKTSLKLTPIIPAFFTLLLLIGMPVQPALQTRGMRVTGNTALSTEYRPLSSRPEQADQQVALSSPPDPPIDIPWSAGTGGVADIQAAFNNARMGENNQLGSSIPMMTLPSQTEWNNMSDGQKALWLINRERIDRGVAPLDGLESNVNSVAQYYADYLLNNNAWGHSADGRSPWQRLSDNPAIGACQDFLSISENLAVFVTSGSSIPLPIERSIYMWMYEDGNCCNWGHRHAILWYPYNDNGGPVGSEGFLGIGRANGGPYQGPFSQSWPFAEMIVMNVFDPCASWTYSFPPGVASLLSPFGNIPSSNPTYTWNISPDSATEDPATWYNLYVSGPSGYVFTSWYRAVDVCSAGTCSVANATTLGAGEHRWWVQTWNSSGYGPWSTGMSFNTPTSAPPGAATLVSPNGNIMTGNPTYIWNKVSDATWYYLYLSGPSGYVFTSWYLASTVCGASTCSVANAAPGLASGQHRWWIQTWNSSGGYGPWSTGMSFSPTLPAATTLVSPSGTTSDHTPLYTWSMVSGATWYYVYVDGPSGNVIQTWYPASAVCGASTCSVEDPTILGSGTHRWWVQTWNNVGYGPWSAGLNFTVAP